MSVPTGQREATAADLVARSHPGPSAAALREPHLDVVAAGPARMTISEERAHAAAWVLAGAATTYAGWLLLVYSRPKYDTPCGAILGPRANYHGFAVETTCGITHWWTVGLATFCVVVAGAAVLWRRRRAALGILVVSATAVEVWALLVVALVANSYSEPVLGEAWTSARDLLATTVAIQSAVVVTVLLGSTAASARSAGEAT